MVNVRQEFLDTLARTAEESFADLGFEHYAICSIRADEFGPCSAGLPMHVTNYAQEWADHYTDSQFFSTDPVLQFGRLVSYPISWTDLRNAPGFLASHAEVLDQARDFGLQSGMCMSVHNIDGSLLLASLASSRQRSFGTALKKELARRVQALTELPGGQVNSASCNYDLTKREVECLSWCAIGKTSSDISAILGISNNTVDFHLKSAMRKLSANSRIFAIVKALKSGLISV